MIFISSPLREEDWCPLLPLEEDDYTFLPLWGGGMPSPPPLGWWLSFILPLRGKIGLLSPLEEDDFHFFLLIREE
jgi:hypothetical protein